MSPSVLALAVLIAAVFQGSVPQGYRNVAGPERLQDDKKRRKGMEATGGYWRIECHSIAASGGKQRPHQAEEAIASGDPCKVIPMIAIRVHRFPSEKGLGKACPAQRERGGGEGAPATLHLVLDASFSSRALGFRLSCHACGSAWHSTTSPMDLTSLGASGASFSSRSGLCRCQANEQRRVPFRLV